MSSHSDSKDDITDRLIELIPQLSKEHKRKLLNILEEKVKKRRKTPRKTFFTEVDYATSDRAYKDFIHDISSGGLFIETNKPLAVGQDILITFTLPKHDKPIKVSSQVVWADDKGIGVQFKLMDPEIEDIIKVFVTE